MKRCLILLTFLLLSVPGFSESFDAEDKVLYFNADILIDAIKKNFDSKVQLDVAKKYTELMDDKGNVSIADLIMVCGVDNLDSVKCRKFIGDLIAGTNDDTIKPFYWADYVKQDPGRMQIQGFSSGDGVNKNPGLNNGEWAIQYDWMKVIPFTAQYQNTKYIRGTSACTNDVGTPFVADSGKNFAPNENRGKHCWCKMIGPEESPWVYHSDRTGDNIPCTRDCPLQCLSAMRYEPMRAAMFNVVKMNGSNANTDDESVITDDLVAAVTPPPPPKPKPAPTPEPEPQPDPCWKYEDVESDEGCAINFDGYHYVNYGNLTKCSGLVPGQWRAVFDCDGGTIVTGRVQCAHNGGKRLQKGAPRGEGGRHCWCKAETESTPYNFTPVWIHYQEFSDSASCANQCAHQCYLAFAVAYEIRTALFGLKYD